MYICSSCKDNLRKKIGKLRYFANEKTFSFYPYAQSTQEKNVWRSLRCVKHVSLYQWGLIGGGERNMNEMPVLEKDSSGAFFGKVLLFLQRENGESNYSCFLSGKHHFDGLALVTVMRTLLDTLWFYNNKYFLNNKLTRHRELVLLWLLAIS